VNVGNDELWEVVKKTGANLNDSSKESWREVSNQIWLNIKP